MVSSLWSFPGEYPVVSGLWFLVISRNHPWCLVPGPFSVGWDRIRYAGQDKVPHEWDGILLDRNGIPPGQDRVLAELDSTDCTPLVIT